MSLLPMGVLRNWGGSEGGGSGFVQSKCVRGEKDLGLEVFLGLRARTAAFLVRVVGSAAGPPQFRSAP